MESKNMAFVKRARKTRGWTEGFLLTLVLAVLTAGFSFIVVMGGTSPVWAELLLVGFVIAASVGAGAVGGLVVGLSGAALHIFLGGFGGDWGAHGATLSVTAVCSFLIYGWSFGLTAAHLRRRQEADGRQAATAGAGHSQGLLTAAEGRAVLDMKAEHARVSGDHLAVLIVTATIREGVGPRQSAHAFRAIARTFEAAASGNQQPVLVSADTLAMVIPGGGAEDGNRLEESLMSAMAEATYANRDTGTRPKASTALLMGSEVVVLTASEVRAEAVFSLPERRLARAEQHAAVSSRTAA
jgi:hypothetical protein